MIADNSNRTAVLDCETPDQRLHRSRTQRPSVGTSELLNVNHLVKYSLPLRLTATALL